MEAMAWMKEHTAPVSDVSPTNDDGVLEPAYGVLNWWDSGYYIITLAGRIPVSNPTQTGASAAAAWFLDSSATVLDDLRENSIRYIMSDALVSMIPDAEGTYQGQFLALPTWAGRRQIDFVEEVFFPTPKGGFEKRLAYYPAYYRSLAYRLSFGGGQAVSPITGATWVIKTEVRAISGSTFGKVVTASQSFSSYDAAIRFMIGSPQNTWTIAGFNPFSPSITLDELKGVREVFTSSDVALAHPALPRPVPMLSIFEVLPVPVQ